MDYNSQKPFFVSFQSGLTGKKAILPGFSFSTSAINFSAFSGSKIKSEVKPASFSKISIIFFIIHFYLL